MSPPFAPLVFLARRLVSAIVALAVVIASGLLDAPAAPYAAARAPIPPLAEPPHPEAASR